MPRYHHQYWPDRVEIEPDAFPSEWRSTIAAKGHTLHVVSRPWGNMQVVFRPSGPGAARAANDPRGDGVGWY
jgi:gamma-glutamyltranspeptidase/glutathione hydrolase